MVYLKRLGVLLFFLALSFALVSAEVKVSSNTSRVQIRTSAFNLSTFLQLTDTPNTYSGSGGTCLKVNIGETAITFGSCGNGTDTWGANQSSYYNRSDINNLAYFNSSTWNTAWNSSSADTNCSVAGSCGRVAYMDFSQNGGNFTGNGTAGSSWLKNWTGILGRSGSLTFRLGGALQSFFFQDSVGANIFSITSTNLVFHSDALPTNDNGISLGEQSTPKAFANIYSYNYGNATHVYPFPALTEQGSAFFGNYSYIINASVFKTQLDANLSNYATHSNVISNFSSTSYMGYYNFSLVNQTSFENQSNKLGLNFSWLKLSILDLTNYIHALITSNMSNHESTYKHGNTTAEIEALDSFNTTQEVRTAINNSNLNLSDTIIHGNLNLTKGGNVSSNMYCNATSCYTVADFLIDTGGDGVGQNDTWGPNQTEVRSNIIANGSQQWRDQAVNTTSNVLFNAVNTTQNITLPINKAICFGNSTHICDAWIIKNNSGVYIWGGS